MKRLNTWNRVATQIFWYCAFFYWYQVFSISAYGIKGASPFYLIIWRLSMLLMFCCFSCANNAFPLAVPRESEASKKDESKLYCEKCQHWKPERAHHCSQCCRCVLRMDHHCFWIGTCVGFENHKYFMQFLFYGLVSSWLVFFAAPLFFTQRFMKMLENEDLYFINIHYGVFIFAWFNVQITSCVLSMLLGWQCWLLVSNSTSLEYYGKSRMNNAMSGWWAVSYYDLGSGFTNFKELFGYSWQYWLLPLESTPGDGTHFPVKAADENKA